MDEYQPRRSPASERFIGMFSSSSPSSPTEPSFVAGNEFHDDDFLFSASPAASSDALPDGSRSPSRVPQGHLGLLAAPHKGDKRLLVRPPSPSAFLPLGTRNLVRLSSYEDVFLGMGNPSSASPPSLMTPSSPKFMGAMISNLALVFGNIFSKRGMKGKSVSGMNYYAYLSIMSLVILTPFAIAMEGPQMWTAGWQKALANVGPNVIWWVGAQSVFYNLYNQVSYISLDEISPLTFSIGNTMKLISLIVSSIIIFHTPVTCPSCQCTRSCYCHPRHIPVFSGKTVKLRCWQGQGHG